MSWESQGAKARLAVSTNASMTNSNSVWLEMLSENIMRNDTILNPNGIRGTRNRSSERNRRGPRAPSGQIVVPLSRIALDNLLPALLGASESSDTFDTAESLPTMYAMIDKLTDVFLLSEWTASKGVISGSSGGLLQLALDVEAEDLIEDQTFPTATTTFRPDVSSVYQFADTTTVSLQSAARNFFGFQIEVDNVLTKGDFSQGLTRDGTISAEDRIVRASFDIQAVTANADLVEPGLDPAGENVVFTITNAVTGEDIIITLGRFSIENAIPTVDGKGRKIIRVQGPVTAYGHPGVTGHVPDISIVNRL